jgi:hypothetical protein
VRSLAIGNTISEEGENIVAILKNASGKTRGERILATHQLEEH